MEAFIPSEKIIFLIFFPQNISVFYHPLESSLCMHAHTHTHKQNNSPEKCHQNPGTWGRQLEFFLPRKNFSHGVFASIKLRLKQQLATNFI